MNIGDKIGLLGRFELELWRGGACIGRSFSNQIVDVGMNLLLDQGFRNQAGIAAWYFGLVDNAGFSAFANADTMGSHAGWAEFTGYTEANRQAWTTIAAAARSITNTTLAVFSPNATGVLKGAFVTSSLTKGGATGTLWSEGAFVPGTISVINGDSVKITYALSG